MSENALDLRSQNRSFGRYLKKVREDRKLSLDAVEEMTMRYPGRVTKSHLSRIENGQAEPTFPRMFALSQVYGLPISSMAERFESDLRKASTPAEIGGRPVEDLIREAEALRASGRCEDALLRCEALIDREAALGSARVTDVRIDRIGCLVQLWRFALAKEACEDLLGSDSLTEEQRIQVLHLFTSCCYRLGKFAIALMCCQTLEAEMKTLPPGHRLHAFFSLMRGNLLRATGDIDQAAAAFHNAVEQFEQLGDALEACRCRLNFAIALSDLRKPSEARRQVQKVILQARAGGFDRQLSHAMQTLGKVAFDEGNLAEAEAHFVQSNSIARRAEFVPVVFGNCYYLWRIARTRGDESAARANERTLRAYLGRVEEQMMEARDFRQYLVGGGS